MEFMGKGSLVGVDERKETWGNIIGMCWTSQN